VTPLLKKHGLDDNDPASFRPISNLNTISKILERLVLTRIVPLVSTSSNFDAHQSAYERHHSTETALLKITDDIFERFSDRQSTVLVALDQSAAFDCVDHEILLHRLNHSFGVTGKALVWIQSYLDERSTFVRWKKESSKCSPLANGVPQDSLLDIYYFHCILHRCRLSFAHLALSTISMQMTLRFTLQPQRLSYQPRSPS
jgi:Reverse transcriptase (RNA-dependent DNA polymerase)